MYWKYSAIERRYVASAGFIHMVLRRVCAADFIAIKILLRRPFTDDFLSLDFHEAFLIRGSGVV